MGSISANQPKQVASYLLHELGLFLLDLRPLQKHLGDVGECVWVEQGVPSGGQVGQFGWTMGRRAPICKPNPLAADYVYQRVSHGTETSSQIAGERLGAERGRSLQDPVGCPAVTFVQKLNVLSGHVSIATFSQHFGCSKIL